MGFRQIKGILMHVKSKGCFCPHGTRWGAQNQVHILSSGREKVEERRVFPSPLRDYTEIFTHLLQRYSLQSYL